VIVMERGDGWQWFRLVSTAMLLVACGGATSGDPGGSGGGPAGGGDAGGSGGQGGAGPSTGGVPSMLPACDNPVAAGTPCSVPSAHCGGPCSNSWQVENICRNGKWETSRVVPCGPNASHAPQCKNSFGGGALTPCCPEGNLACAGQPDGYPGFGCTPGDGSFCSCSCYGGMSVCGC
jgi:hypothetical protein